MAHVTVKLFEETRRLLRLIAAQTDERMVDVAQRLCAAEWERVKPKDTKPAPADHRSESV